MVSFQTNDFNPGVSLQRQRNNPLSGQHCRGQSIFIILHSRELRLSYLIKRMIFLIKK